MGQWQAVVATIVLVFLCGVSLGVLIGRRYPAPTASPATASTTAVDLPGTTTDTPSAAVAATRPARPTAGPTTRTDGGGLLPADPPKRTWRSRKIVLDESTLVPSDDILEKLRLAAEGELDPSALHEEPATPPPAEPALPRPELTEAERRVLERLEREGHRPEGET